MKTAILIPLPEELSILLAGLEQCGWQKRKLHLGNLEVFEFKEFDLLIALGGHGKTQFGIQAQYLFCQEPQIQLLVCAGAAGALSRSLKIGDIVAATATVEHDYNLKFVSRPLPRFIADTQILNILQELPKTDFNFSTHFGAIASGDEDVVTLSRGQKLAQTTGCIAVAWEGAGGARACKFSQKRFVELRGVTDTADRNAATDFEVNLVTAMTNLTQLVMRWHEALK